MSAVTSLSRTLRDRTPAPPRERSRFALDPIRGLAAVAVIFYHAHQNQRGPSSSAPADDRLGSLLHLTSDLAVGIFFVLSGFVLFLPIVRAALAGGSMRSGRDLLRRRFARLLPLYVLVVLVVWGATNPRIPGNWQDLVLHLTMTHVYSETYIFWTVGPAWSLAVEFHFYVLMALVAPLLGRWCARLTTRRARRAVVLSLPILLVVAGEAWLLWAVGHRALDSWPTWFGPLAKAPIFGVGMILAVVVAEGVELRSALARRAAVLGGLAVLVLVTVARPPYDESVLVELWHLPLALVSVLWLAAIVLDPGSPQGWLARAELVWLGTMSYGIYLLHEPLMRLARSIGLLPERDGGSWDWLVVALVVLPVTLVAARLSHTLVERNGLRLLEMYDRTGKARDYYDHPVGAVDLATVETPLRLVGGHVPAQRRRD